MIVIRWTPRALTATRFAQRDQPTGGQQHAGRHECVLRRATNVPRLLARGTLTRWCGECSAWTGYAGSVILPAVSLTADVWKARGQCVLGGGFQDEELLRSDVHERGHPPPCGHHSGADACPISPRFGRS